MTVSQEFQLSSKIQPKDGISFMEFHPTSPMILGAASWDKGVRVYDVGSNSMVASWNSKAAVLACSWLKSGEKLISGGLDRSCASFNVATQQVQSIGAHDAPISCIATSQEDLIATGSWDKSVKLWDLRHQADTPATVLPQNDKVFSMDISGNMLVVALAGRTIQIYDTRNTSEPYQTRESTLKHMIRKVKCIPLGTGYASSSIEGRVSVDFFDPAPHVQAQKFSFKCHREKNNGGQEVIHPVNALAYHPIHQQTFASGGGDGVVNIWDGSQKKRLRQFTNYPTSISSLSFNSDGSLLAISSSYTFEEGEKDHPSDSIFIRPIADQDVEPKQRK